MKKLLLLVLLLTSTAAWSEDENNEFWTQGGWTCGEFGEIIKTRRGRIVVHAWASGYVQLSTFSHRIPIAFSATAIWPAPWRRLRSIAAQTR